MNINENFRFVVSRAKKVPRKFISLLVVSVCVCV